MGVSTSKTGGWWERWWWTSVEAAHRGEPLTIFGRRIPLAGDRVTRWLWTHRKLFDTPADIEDASWRAGLVIDDNGVILGRSEPWNVRTYNNWFDQNRNFVLRSRPVRWIARMLLGTGFYERRMTDVEEAYRVLSDEKLIKKYDELREIKGSISILSWPWQRLTMRRIELGQFRQNSGHFMPFL